MPPDPSAPPHGRPSRTIRAAFVTLTVGTAAVPAGVLGTLLATDGIAIREAVQVALYAVLVLWVGANFWLSAFGALRLMRGAGGPRASRSAPDDAGSGRPSRTAIVMLVCDEDAAGVFARLRAMYRSLEAESQIGGFEFFVLSDSRQPDVWLAEELEWFEACRELGAGGRLFYRRRAENHERKVGNIKDFLERWGRRYDYMVVLDADSVMEARTLTEMVRRMDREPDLGLLQVWPRPVGGETLFARLQQFAASAYGRLTASGMAWLLGDDGNYWGHNAIIRTRAFIESCGLPQLPGKEPLGGSILSHDFVEAALLRRAGWKVRLVDDLGGSYEQGPPDFIEYARRDRRWCQGNLQHARLILARGLKFPSRVNFVVGILAYAAAPLWLLFLVTGALAAISDGVANSIALSGLSTVAGWSPGSGDPAMFGLLIFTLGLLLGPKLMGLTTILVSRSRRRRHGSGLAATASVLMETVFTALVAPILMLLHTQFVATVLAGRSVCWNPQRRCASDISWRDARRAFQGILVSGLVLVGVVASAAPPALVWLLPILTGLLAGVPLTLLTGRASLRGAFGRSALLLTPEDVAPPKVLRLVATEMCGRRPRDARECYRRLLEDPQFNAVHCALLGRGSGPATDAVGRLVTVGPDVMTTAEKARALADVAGLRRLHALLWTRGALQSTRSPAVANAS